MTPPEPFPSMRSRESAIAGIWGILAVGLFPRAAAVAPGAANPATMQGGQMLAQVVGVATLVGFVLPLTYSLNWLLDRFFSQRIPPEEERQGADLYELGAGAYPEFMTHTDEFSQW
jgi:Amt family ammonium transporter